MGLPPSGGFLAKWLLLQAAWASGPGSGSPSCWLGSLLAAGYVFRVLAAVFANLPRCGAAHPGATRPPAPRPHAPGREPAGLALAWPPARWAARRRCRAAGFVLAAAIAGRSAPPGLRHDASAVRGDAAVDGVPPRWSPRAGHLPDRRGAPALRTTHEPAAAVLKLVLIGVMLVAVRGRVVRVALPLLPGLDLVLKADALTLLFATLSAVLWLLTTVYAIGYLERSPEPRPLLRLLQPQRPPPWASPWPATSSPSSSSTNC
jgi:hypothetical protein